MFKKWGYIISGPLLALLVYCCVCHVIPESAARMTILVVWVGFWWLTEALHLGITSLLPFVLLPLFGIIKTEDVAMLYMDQVIFLFMGGFFLAYAMEKWGLHKRVAYRIIMMTGNTPSKILLGIMLTSYLLSNWVSNTATVMMLIPAVLAIVKQKELYNEHHQRNISTAILLGLSFSATIGGMGTLVGTPPNVIFAGTYARIFPAGQPVTFLNWMMFGIPFSATMLVMAYFILRKLFIVDAGNNKFDMAFITDQYHQLGKMCFQEKMVLSVFVVTVILWLFRVDIDINGFIIPGWSNLLGSSAAYIKDSTVVIFTSFFLFLIPAKPWRIFIKEDKQAAEPTNDSQEHLLEWKDVAKLPLNIILLFGCGFAIAKGFETSGLSNSIAQQLTALKGLPVVFVLLGVALIVTMLSEFASNTASIQLMLPIVVSLAAALSINPLLLMLTATFSASLGYMLPVATAANTIVYGSGELNAKDMIKAGILLDIAGVALLLLFMLTLGNWIYGFQLFAK